MSALLPLDTFREIIGYHPFHFWGMMNSTVPVSSACNSLVKQYSWQDADACGRSEILRAIETAEARLREYLGYRVAPQYIEETVPWPKYHEAALWRFDAQDGTGRRVGLRLPEGKLISIGTELRTLIGTANLTFSDPDGDTLNDTFTLTIATTVTDPQEIAVYFAAADRLNGAPVGERWRIQPVSVSISGGTATIRGRSWLLANPILYETPSAPALNPATASNLVTTLEVYRLSTYTEGETVDTSQAVLLWETDPCHGWFCCCGACSGLTYTPATSEFDPAAVGKAIARVGIRDALNGIVIPGQSLRNSSTGIWSSVDWSTYREPDRITVRYRAGVPLDSDGQMNETLRTVVARLAAAEMGRRICACDAANQELYHWQMDLARGGARTVEQFQVSAEDLSNPLGTRRGQVYAWHYIKNMTLGGGIAM